jgi:anaphase-promoting complex subunit 2
VKVLELLKARFGEGPLQACEVMLNDMQESEFINRSIRLMLKNNNVHTKILSRLFWPQLQDTDYRIPDEIKALQENYKTRFESVKTSRKLSWLPALGQATVELQLEDREVVEEVHTWQATVIWAFSSEEPGLQRTVQELVQDLEMEETMVRSALKFWINKLVLHEVSLNTFAVLETLNQEDRARSNAQAATSAAAGANDESADDTGLVANDGISEQKKAMYWQFIQGMLKNSSSQMPLQQISMMLTMLVVDGFPFGNEQLQELLARKVEDGSLEMVGGKYRLKK